MPFEFKANRHDARGVTAYNAPMHRLFIAIRPPRDVRAALMPLMTGVDGARWQDDDQLHLTLRFVGDVDRPVAEDVADALTHVRFAPFTVNPAGIGSFDRRGIVDTLWAGVHPVEPLRHLHHKVDRACVMAGLPPESRAYLPHVTLARFSRHGGFVDPFLLRHAPFAGPSFTVTEFMLFESRLGHSGARYEAVERYQAGG